MQFATATNKTFELHQWCAKGKFRNIYKLGIFQSASLALGFCFADHRPQMLLPEPSAQFAQPQVEQPPLIL